MSSLANCLKKLGISGDEAKLIRKAAQQYRTEGFAAQEANEGAIKDILSNIQMEYDSIQEQLKSTTLEKAIKEAEVIPEKKPTLPKQPKNIIGWIRKKGGINYKDETWKGELDLLKEDLNQGKRFGTGTAIINTKGKLTLDELAQMAYADGYIQEAKPQLLLDALKGRQAVAPVVEKQAETNIEQKQGKNTVQIFPKPEDEGTRYLIQNRKTGEVEEYVHKGLDAKGEILIENGELHKLDFGEDIWVQKVLPKGEQFFKSQEIKEKPKKATQQDMIGYGQALEGKLVSKEMKEDTPLEKAIKEAEERKFVEERQTVLPPMQKSPDNLGGIDFQTRQENFKKWFAGSKVVDEKGEPLVVYHGSATPSIEIFDINKTGSIQKSDWGKGIYFTPSKWNAQLYSEDAILRTDKEGDALYKAYEQKAKELGTRPMHEAIDLGFDSAEYKELKAVLDKWLTHRETVRKKKNYNVYETYLSIKNPMYYKYVGITDPFLAEQAKSKGHDGIFITDRDGDIEEIIAFEPTQIKSAIANRGTFDPMNPSMLYSGLPFDETVKQIKKFLGQIGNLTGITQDPRVIDYTKTAEKLNVINKTLNTRSYIAEKFPLYKQVYDKLRQIYKDRDVIMSDLSEIEQPYYRLAKESAQKVNQALEAGTLENQVFNNETLTKRFSLDDKEKTAYWKMRKKYDKSLKMLEDYFIDEVYEVNRERVKEAEARLKEMAEGEVLHPQWAERAMGLDERQTRQYNYLNKKYGDALDGLLKEYVEKHGEEGTQDRLRDLYAYNKVRDEFRGVRGYVPLARFGKHTLTVKKADGSKIYMHFENSFKRNAVANKMARKYSDAQIIKGTAEQSAKENIFEGIDAGTLQLIANVAKIDPSISDPFIKEVQDFYKTSGFKRHFIHREKTAGYSQNWDRVHADYTVGLANYIARSRNIKAAREALVAITDPALHKMAKEDIEYMSKPREEFSKLRNFLFLFYLGFNPKSAALNLTQTFTTTIPYLSQYTKFPSAKVLSAFNEVKKGITVKDGRPYFDHTKLGPELGEALKEAEGLGIASEQMIYEIMGMARGSKLSKNVPLVRAIKASAFMFGTAETFNRRVAFIAAYKVGKNLESQGKLPKGQTVQKFAEKVVDDTQFQYGKYNRPTLGRGIGAPIMTFKQFTIQYIEMIAKLSKTDKVAAAKALSMMFLLSGLKGLPYMIALKEIVEGFTGESWDRIARDIANDIFNHPEIGELIMSGITRFTPFDMSGAIGLGDIIPDLGSLEVLGPAGGIVQRGRNAYKYLKADELLRAAESVMPEFIRNPMAAARIYSEGQRNIKGELISTGEGRWPKNLNVASKAFGVQPSDISRAYERENAQYMIGGKRAEKKRAFVNRIGKAFANNDTAEQKIIWDEIDEYNKDKPEAEKVYIRKQDVKEAKRKRTADEDVSGLRRTPLQGRNEYERVRELFK